MTSATPVENVQQPTNESAPPSPPPPTPTPKPAAKHPLDWVLATFALLSLVGNVYQWRANGAAVKLDQAPPVIYRVQMPVTDALLFRSLHQRKDLLFGAFPNPGFVATPELKAAINGADTLKPVQKNATLWTFVVMRNVSKFAYDASSVTADGTVRTTSTGPILPGETRFVYLGDGVKRGLRVAYRIHGADSDIQARVPAVGSNEVLLLTELSISSLGAIRFANDEERELAAIKMTPASPAEPH